MNLKKLITIGGLFLVLSINGNAQEFTNCTYQLIPEVKNNPIHCYEYEFWMRTDNGKEEMLNLNYIRKYSFDGNKLLGWVENTKFHDLLDSLDGYFETVINHNDLGKAINLRRATADKIVDYKEDYSYKDGENKILADLDYKGRKSTREIDCAKNERIDKDDNDEITSTSIRKDPLTEKRTVFFKKAIVKKVETIFRTEVLRKDELGNAIVLTKKEENKDTYKRTYRHYVYAENNVSKKRTIDEAIDAFINSFKKGNFDDLVDEVYLLREEAMLLNSPYLGKKYLPGVQFIALATDEEAKEGVKNYLTRIRDRKKLDWSKVHLKKIIDRETTEGAYGVGKNIFSSRCEFSISDEVRSHTFYLNFIKVGEEWCIYLQK